MITLIPMDPSDFDAYLALSIVEYADDKIRSGNWHPEEALDRSRQEFEKLLFAGLQTPDQFIYTVFDEERDQKLGMLWVNVPMAAPHREAFIFDFRIDEAFRGQGFGKKALLALDEILIRMGVESVGLHVFAFNTTALELYKRVGYEITNINMRKVYTASAVKSSGA